MKNYAAGIFLKGKKLYAIESWVGASKNLITKVQTIQGQSDQDTDFQRKPTLVF